MTTYKTADGLEFQGETDVVPSVVACLFGDDYARVVQHLPNSPLKFHSKWFLEGDKGCFRAWGLNMAGEVVCGLRLEPGMQTFIKIVKMSECAAWLR